MSILDKKLVKLYSAIDDRFDALAKVLGSEEAKQALSNEHTGSMMGREVYTKLREVIDTYVAEQPLIPLQLRKDSNEG